MYLNGLKIVKVCDQPKYTLPADLPLPAGFREEFKAWALQWLGTTNVVPKGQMLICHGDTAYVNEHDYYNLIAAAKDSAMQGDAAKDPGLGR